MATRALPGTPAWLGATNDRAALLLLLEHDALTRNQLAELSGLSKPTAAQMISRLETAGIIEAFGELSGGRGPNAVAYRVRRGDSWGVAIDVQPEVIRSTLVDAAGGSTPVVVEHFLRPEGAGDAVTQLRGALDRAAAAAGVDPARVTVGAVGIQAAISPVTGELVFTDELPGWPRANVRDQLESALGLELLIHNDVNLAAVAERAQGAGRETGGFVLFWVGNGLGLAVDIAGTLHTGAAGGAGEIGYLGVPREAAEIEPDAVDLQDLMSFEALARVAQRNGIDVETFEELAVAVETLPGDSAVVIDIATRIALGVAPVLAVLDPEVLILSGPLGGAGGSRLAELVAERVAANTRWSPRILSSGVKENPILLGAQQILTERLRELMFSRVR